MEQLKKLFEVAQHNVASNPTIVEVDTSKVIKRYLFALRDEVVEVEEELREENAVHLQDELSDIIWNNAVLLELCVERGLIDSVDAVYEHALEKYTERSPAFLKADQELWNEIKAKQKADLKQRHMERYGT